MTTNLRKDLEALYYFGEQDFKPQRNQLQDHSGYGRHGRANGSVTFGNNGVNDFEVGSFSGTGTGDRVDIPMDSLAPPFSVSMLVKQRKRGVDANSDLFFFHTGTGNNNNYTIRSRKFRSRIQFFFYDSSGNKKEAPIASDGLNEYRLLTVVAGNNEVRGYVNDFKGFTRNATPIINNTNKHPVIASDNSGSNNMKSDIAMFGYWSRTISYAEIERLNELTAPLRAQL